MSMKRKKVGHEQGLNVQLSIVGQFFPRRPPPKRNCLGTSLYRGNECITKCSSIVVSDRSGVKAA